MVGFPGIVTVDERMKEELAGIKECRNAQVIIGVVVIIYGLVLAFPLSYNGNLAVAVGILVSFTVIGIIFLVMASDCARDYRDKLKEVKKGNK